MASSDGRIFDSNCVERNYYRQNDGYVTVSLKQADGSFATVGVHRLIALTFVSNPFPETHDQVNHRDLNTANNSYQNLEWVTQWGNNVHSEIMKGVEGRPVILVERENGETVLFRSTTEAMNVLGVDALGLWDLVKNKNSKVCYIGNRENIPAQHRKKIGIDVVRRAEQIAVTVNDLEMDCTRQYVSIGQCAAVFGTSPSHIFQTIATSEKLKLFRKRYLIWETNAGKPVWPDEELEKAMGRGSKEVLAYNFSTGAYSAYESASKFYKKNRLSKKIVTVTLIRDKIREYGDWVFLYRTEENTKRLKTYTGCPDPVS
jgi:hypothetical protein